MSGEEELRLPLRRELDVEELTERVFARMFPQFNVELGTWSLAPGTRVFDAIRSITELVLDELAKDRFLTVQRPRKGASRADNANN